MNIKKIIEAVIVEVIVPLVVLIAAVIGILVYPIVGKTEKVKRWFFLEEEEDELHQSGLHPR